MINIKTLAIEIEDRLIDNYDYNRNRSFAILSDGSYYIDADYSDGKLCITVGGNATNNELPNIEKAIADAVDVDRIDNEINLFAGESDYMHYECGYQLIGY